MIHPSSAYEALKSGDRRRLFTLFGVPWTVTANSWQFVVSRFAMGILIALLFLPAYSFALRFVWGLGFGLLVGLSNLLHIFGHFISGKWAGAPMDENLVTAYSILTAYHENPEEVPGRVHLARAAGGPLMTLAVGLISLAGWLIFGGPAFAFMALLNLILFIQVSLPIPTADGEVIWREIRALSNASNTM